MSKRSLLFVDERTSTAALPQASTEVDSIHDATIRIRVVPAPEQPFFVTFSRSRVWWPTHRAEALCGRELFEGLYEGAPVWTISSGGQDIDTEHSTQKPVECMRRPMLNNSNVGQAVYDPFLGSGTTLIAAETSGRVCFGIELDPRYVDVAVRRWEAFTGKNATLLGDGRTFDQIATERQQPE